MAKLKLLSLGPLLGLLAAPAAQAQVTIDVSKITCEQFLQSKVAAPRIIGIWLSGYYNGKRNNTVLDTLTVEKNGTKVARYCRSNLNMTVMQAVENVLGAGK